MSTRKVRRRQTTRPDILDIARFIAIDKTLPAMWNLLNTPNLGMLKRSKAKKRLTDG